MIKFKNYLSIIKSNDNYRVLLENFLSLSSLQLFNYIIPFITLPYLVRVLGVDAYGKYAFAYSFMLFFQSFVDYGFNYTATREVAKNRNSIEFCAKYFNLVFFSKLVLLFISLIIYVAVLSLIDQFRNDYVLFSSSFLLLMSYTIFPEWFFLGIERMKVITILNSIVRLLYAVSIFIFIKKPSHSYIIFLLYSFSYFLICLYSFYYIKKIINFNLKFSGFNNIYRHLKSGFSVFIVNFIPMIYNNGTTFVLGLISSNYYVGIYDAARKMIEVGVSVINILSRVFYPFLNRFTEKFILYRNISLVIGITISLIFFLFAQFITSLILGDAFSQSVLLLKIMSFSVFFISIYSAYGTNYLLIHKFDGVLMSITIFASTFGLIMIFPMVHYFNAIGASVNISFSRLILGTGAYLFYLKLKRMYPKNQFK